MRLITLKWVSTRFSQLCRGWIYSFSMSRASQMASNCFARKTPPLSVMRRLSCSKLLDCRIQDNEDAGQVLALKDIAGKNSSREGIHHGDHIKRALDLRDPMLFDVADID